MPGYKAHIVGGIGVYIGVVIFFGLMYLYPPVTLFEWCGAMLIGSLFPDIDTKSKIQKIVYSCLLPVLFFLLVYEQFLSAGICACCGCIPLIVSHRGIFHAWWALATVCCVVGYILSSLFSVYSFLIISNIFFFFLGCMVHVALDFGGSRFRL